VRLPAEHIDINRIGWLARIGRLDCSDSIW
jgi:hypothetical protein